jgi:hypothetical protein
VSEAERGSFPIQGGGEHPRTPGKTNRAVYMRAYMVYCRLWGEQEALVNGSCRGGFGKAELLALVYAAGFPEHEWKQRFNEALKGTDI